MRVVLDNNVLISGIFWKGAPHRIIELAEDGKIKIFTSRQILEELFGVLQREKFDSLFEEGRTKKEDPEDNKFLACADSCQASFIVSGDKHLLKLKNYQSISMVLPSEFLKLLKNKK